MVRIMTPLAISLAPEPLDENTRSPALEHARALLDAFYHVVAVQFCFFRFAHQRVQTLDPGGPDGGGLEGWFTVKPPSIVLNMER